MELVNMSVFNVINTVCDFFTEITDVPSCRDAIINNRLRELMFQNPQINQSILHILGELVKNMKTIPNYDHYDLEQFEEFTKLIPIMSSGWFNYDKYTGHYSELEIGDFVYTKIQETISNEAERLNYTCPSVDDLFAMLHL